MDTVSDGIIRVQEYQTVELPLEHFSIEAAQILQRSEYSSLVDVAYPTIVNSVWQLAANGWVGFIPLVENIALALEPKTTIQNLFGMFEYAYRLKSFRFGDGLIQTQSLQEVYEQLASVLARRVLDRSRKGFYRTYLAEENRLAYIRGRFDLRHNLRRPWETNLYCHYHEHTADVEENQLLAWTLWRIIRSGYCTDRVLPTVRKAYRAVQGFVSLLPFSADECDGRFYHRLNQDYHPMHALSRFFLAQSGPSHYIGDREMVPFVVNMAQLYELFVAEWLTTHGPERWRIKAKVTLPFGSQHQMKFQPDIIIEDVATGRAVAVLDTKYKVTETPAYSDITQMTTYAHMVGCRDAVLIYPVRPPQAESYDLRGIKVHSVAFAIDDDLELAGERFLNSISELVKAEE